MPTLPTPEEREEAARRLANSLVQVEETLAVLQTCPQATINTTFAQFVQALRAFVLATITVTVTREIDLALEKARSSDVDTILRWRPMLERGKKEALQRITD